MSDNVEHPSHYNAGSVETIEGIKAALGDAFLDYCRGNVLKYAWRCRHKGKLLEDLRKAAKYLEWAIEEAESEKPSEPEPLAIPDGWRELEFGETRLKTDMYSYGGKWNPYTDFDPSGSEFPKYDKRIHHQHIRKIETENASGSLAGKQGYFDDADGVWVDEPNPFDGRKIETANPSHVEGVWVEEADANARKIEPTETSDASIPDPGPGYRLLSKDPPERVQEGDEFWCDTDWMKWWPSSADCGSAVQSKHDYYRRKIEPAEWFPKVGDKVRVVGGFMNPKGEVGVIKNFCPVVNGNFSILAHEGRCTLGWFKKDDVELIEAAQ